MQPDKAFAWWNEDWEYRIRINIQSSGTDSTLEGNISNKPVLLRLHSGNFSFFNAKEDGSDLRFISSDDQTSLAYDIEYFDAVDEIGFIWVKAPRISSGPGDNHIFLYYGNLEAAPGQDKGKTYDLNQVGVYHLNEETGMPQDISAYANHAVRFTGFQGMSSIIGLGVSLGGAGNKIIIPVNPAMDFSMGFTLSAWVMPVSFYDDVDVISIQDKSGSEVIALSMRQDTLYGRYISESGQTREIATGAALSTNSYHHLAFTISPDGIMRIYVNGIEQGAGEYSIPYQGILEEIIIGEPLGKGFGFAGDIDEIRVSNTARSNDWIKIDYSNQGPDGAWVALWEEEISEQGGMLLFYLNAIAKNISMDGWFIISILLIMACLSWITFFTKVYYLRLITREDAIFLDVFNSLSDPLGLDNEKAEEFHDSALYRIYSKGFNSLVTRLQNSQISDTKARLTPKMLDAFRVTLEEGFILETQRFNTKMIFMILAISGGPFLGLLGTVWGVMNTFAAMAVAGEANIMAIAPGIASALATTVMGLLVAIPALFGYNYLSGVIRNVSARLGIFIDQLVVCVDEKHG